jgi:hypothetical protein
MTRLTLEEIEAGRSPRGGWTRATLAGWGVPWPPPKGWQQRLLEGDSASPESRKSARRENGSTARPVPVLVGVTGAGNVIPEAAEYWPPWEEPPVAGCVAESGITVSGLVWCPIHQEYEELRDGVSAVRLASRL